MSTAVLLRVHNRAQPLYASVTQMVTREYACVMITAEHDVPGYRKGSQHVVPTWRLSVRRPRHRRRWWHRLTRRERT